MFWFEGKNNRLTEKLVDVGAEGEIKTDLFLFSPLFSTEHKNESIAHRHIFVIGPVWSI